MELYRSTRLPSASLASLFDYILAAIDHAANPDRPHLHHLFPLFNYNNRHIYHNSSILPITTLDISPQPVPPPPPPPPPPPSFFDLINPYDPLDNFIDHCITTDIIYRLAIRSVVSIYNINIASDIL